jgi:hypothetical protein
VNSTPQKIPSPCDGIHEGERIQYYKELKSESNQEDEDWNSEGDPACDLQCADSLAIAANRRMDEGCSVIERFGGWILRGFHKRGRCSLS